MYTPSDGLKTMAVYTIKGDKAYIIEYIAGPVATYSSYLPISQRMIDSFQIVFPSPATNETGGPAPSTATQPVRQTTTQQFSTYQNLHME